MYFGFFFTAPLVKKTPKVTESPHLEMDPVLKPVENYEALHNFYVVEQKYSPTSFIINLQLSSVVFH
jgi:hypothetical protein